MTHTYHTRYQARLTDEATRLVQFRRLLGGFRSNREIDSRLFYLNNLFSVLTEHPEMIRLNGIESVVMGVIEEVRIIFNHKKQLTRTLLVENRMFPTMADINRLYHKVTNDMAILEEFVV